MNKNRKLGRMGKTVVSGLLVTSLILGNATLIDAKKITKDESVYVNAAANGDVTHVIVSEWLKNAGIGGTLEDESELKDITNIKGDETFEQGQDGIRWNTGVNDIYYQGTTDKEVPVSVKLTYELDGKEMSPKELIGKSGSLKIRVSYENHSKVTKVIEGKKQEVYTPFIMVTGLILPTEKFSNVSVDGGRMINEGTNQIVVGFGAPGMAKSLQLSGKYAKKLPEEFTVTANVTDFEMKNTLTYASADLFSDLDVDRSKSMKDLEDKLDKMSDSSEKLVVGSSDLKEALETLQDKFVEYEKGEKELDQGIQTLAKSGKKLVNGVKEYSTGVDDLAKGVTTYVNGAKQLTDGNKQIYEAVKGMPKSYQEFSAGLKQYTEAVDTLGKKETGDALVTGAAGVAAGIDTLNTNLAALESSYEKYDQLILGLQSQAAQCSDETVKQTLLVYIQKLKELSQGQKASVSALVQGTGAESQLKKGASQVAGGIKQVADGAQTLSEKSQALREADGKLSESIGKIVQNLEKLKKGSEKLSANDRKLLAGAKKLRKAGKTVKDGSSKLVSGSAKLKKGSARLTKATGSVSDGIHKIGDGSDKLADGMKKFDEEAVQKLNEYYEDDFVNVKNRISALLDASEDYKNFAGIKEGMDGKVKFIIKTDQVNDDK